MSMTRRAFLRSVGAAAGALAVAPSLGASAAKENKVRPNIIFAIADDWSWPHAGIYGDAVASTPAFDSVAREGVLFTSAFCAAPTCTASRGAILTGQAPHRLKDGANLWSPLPAEFEVYPDLLEAAGYFVGVTSKGWGPGSFEVGGRKRNSAGPGFPSFEQFLEQMPGDRPFCFWLGSTKPHRPYVKGSGLAAGMRPENVKVPAFLPDTREVREDLLDYYLQVQQFDEQVGGVLALLRASGHAENTLVAVTSDNGRPFPRCKCNVYDSGTRMPLAVRWPGNTQPGRRCDELIGATDFAPTFLEAAGLPVPSTMTGRSFLDILLGKPSAPREAVYVERERHGATRPGTRSYPMRAIRTRDWLYIRNPRPELWPAGDPEPEQSADKNAPRKRPYGDMDPSPSRDYILAHRDEPAGADAYERAMGKRVEEELYDVRTDPEQMNNLAQDPAHEDDRRRMRSALDKWMLETGDPRAKGETDFWDRIPFDPQPPAKKT